MKYPVCSSCIRKAMIEPLVRIGLLFVGLALYITGCAIDWRGYVQGVGGGMCIVLTVWNYFALARPLKPNQR